MGHTISRIKDRWRGISLKDKALSMVTVAIVVSFLVFVVLAALSKVGLLIVKSGSMLPDMPPGALLVFKSSGIEDISSGDSVVFHEDRYSGTLITHRAVDKVFDNGKPYIKTKGDNNHRPDTLLIGEDQLVGKVVYTIPAVGHAMTFTKTPAGLLILSLLLAFFVLLLVIDSVKAAERKAMSSDGGTLIHPTVSVDADRAVE